ncbi:MAG TPA: RNA polymerase sigma factor [Armatimonadota bacterium]
MSDGCEQEWVKRAKRGDRAAFDALLKALEPSIRRFVERLIGRSPATEDILQDAFLSLYLNLDRLEPAENLRPFLYRIVRNRCYDEMRRNGRFRTAPLDDPNDPASPSAWLTDASPTPDATVQRLLMMAEVQRAIDGLPEQQRETLILFAEEGMSLQEVAEATNVEIGTVKSRIFNARKNLTRRITPATRAALGIGKENEYGE